MSPTQGGHASVLSFMTRYGPVNVDSRITH